MAKNWAVEGGWGELFRGIYKRVRNVTKEKNIYGSKACIESWFNRGADKCARRFLQSTAMTDIETQLSLVPDHKLSRVYKYIIRVLWLGKVVSRRWKLSDYIVSLFCAPAQKPPFKSVTFTLHIYIFIASRSNFGKNENFSSGKYTMRTKPSNAFNRIIQVINSHDWCERVECGESGYIQW